MLNSRRERMKVGAIKRVNRAMNRLSFSGKSAPPAGQGGQQMPGERNMGNVAGSVGRAQNVHGIARGAREKRSLLLLTAVAISGRLCGARLERRTWQAARDGGGVSSSALFSLRHNRRLLIQWPL